MAAPAARAVRTLPGCWPRCAAKGTDRRPNLCTGTGVRSPPPAAPTTCKRNSAAEEEVIAGLADADGMAWRSLETPALTA
jgi:hypothetical protein